MHDPVPPPKTSELLPPTTALPPSPPLQQVSQPPPTRRSPRTRQSSPDNGAAIRIIGAIFGGLFSVVLCWGIYRVASSHFEGVADDMARKHSANVENLEERIAELEGQVTKRRAVITSTAADLKDRDSAVADAKRDIEGLEKQVGELVNANEQLAADKNSLEESLADLGEELAVTTGELEEERQKPPAEPNVAISALRYWTVDEEEPLKVKARFVKQTSKEGITYVTLKLKSDGRENEYKKPQLSLADHEFIADNFAPDITIVNQTSPDGSPGDDENTRPTDNSNKTTVDMSKARALWLVGLRRERDGRYDSAASYYGRASRYMGEEDRVKALEVVKHVKAFGAARADAARQAFLSNLGRNSCGSMWMGPIYGWHGGGEYIHIEHIISEPEPPKPKPFRGF